MMDIEIPESSLIRFIGYDREKRTLAIAFHKQGWQQDRIYVDVPISLFEEFKNSQSKGKFFLDNIKNKLKTMAKGKNNQFDMIIDVRIDVTKLMKEWLFKGEKGVYADLTLFYHNDQDPEYKTNGFVTQKVPKAVWENDRNARGPILGNIKNWETVKKEVDKDAIPGATEVATVQTNQDWQDDLPF